MPKLRHELGQLKQNLKWKDQKLLAIKKQRELFKNIMSRVNFD